MSFVLHLQATRMEGRGARAVNCEALQASPQPGTTTRHCFRPPASARHMLRVDTMPRTLRHVKPCRHCRLNKAHATAENTTAKHTDLVKVREMAAHLTCGRCAANSAHVTAGACSFAGSLAVAPQFCSLPGGRVTCCIACACCCRLLMAACPTSWYCQVAEVMKRNVEQEMAGHKAELARQELVRGRCRGGSRRHGSGRGKPHAEVEGWHQAPPDRFRAIRFCLGWPPPTPTQYLPTPLPKATPALTVLPPFLSRLPPPGHSRPGAREGAVCRRGGER